MATTVTNGNIDSAAAAVAGTYGPLTRVTDISTYPTPNSELQIKFTSNVGSQIVYMSYDELADANVRDRILEQAHGFTGVVARIKAAVQTLDAAVDAMTAPHTYEDMEDILEIIRENSGFKLIANMVRGE